MKVRDNASQEWIEILAVKGDKGDKGDDGKGISSAVINSSGNLIITYTDGTTQNAGKVQTSGGGSSGGETTYETITVSTDYILEGLQLANGATYGNAYRLTSDFIAVEEGDEITFSADGDNWEISGCAYTTDKTWVAGFPSDTWEQLGTYTAGGTGYIRVTFRQGGYQGTEFTTADGAKCHITIRRATQGGGGGGSSDIGTIYINRFTLDNARTSGNDVFITLPVEPNTSYTFDARPYTWVGVSVDGVMNGHGGGDQVIEFMTGSSTTEVTAQFYPGFVPSGVNDDRIDYSAISFYKTDGDSLEDILNSKQDKLKAGTGIKISGNTISATGGSGAGLLSPDITEILLTASEASPIEIVLMGDSITEGYSASGMETAGSSHPVPTWANYQSWAGRFNSFITANYPNVTVTNRGYSGQVSGYGATNVGTWITNDRQIAIVMYGTNNRNSAANMNSLANDYTTIKERCDAVGARMVPMCCIPTTTYNQNIEGKYVATMADVHDILSNWAVENGYELVDLYGMMMNYINNDLDNLETMNIIYVGSNDNNLHIHPTDEGHGIMFDFIKYKLGLSAPSGGGNGAYRHRISMYCLSGGTTYVVFNLYNNRSKPYNVATTTTTAEIEILKNDILKAGYTTAVQKGVIQCSGIIKGEAVYGVYMGTSSSGLSAVDGKLNFINGTSFNLTLPLETGDTSSASTSLRVWDTVEPAATTSGGGSSGGSGGGSNVDIDNLNLMVSTLNGFLNPTKTAMPCASGFTNFSNGSVYWKTPDGMVHITAIVTVNNTCNSNTNVFNMPAGYRPAATVVIPGTLAYESNVDPAACGINFNSDGTCRYYGISAPSGRHIMINAEYPSTDAISTLPLF